MELNYSKKDDEFRDKVRTFIKENRPDSSSTAGRGRGGRGAAGWAQWRKSLAEQGWLAPMWPKEYGGAGFTTMEQVIYNEEFAVAEVPRVGGMGVGLVGPTLIAHGSDEQKKRYLPRILEGKDTWCQGFSEPNAGSDLAGLQSKAVKDGDDYLITGQKIWTSGAQTANHCFFLARTDPEASKHKGISYFLVDMKTPGIEIRPIKQITGGSGFCEMFWDKVRVPKENIVGGVNKGFYVAMSTLAHERSGLSSAVGFRRTLERLTHLAQKMKQNGVPRSKDPNVRKKIAQLYFDVHAHTYTGYRNLATQLTGGVPGPAAFIGKIFAAEMSQRIHQLAVELQGPYGQLWVGSPEVIDKGTWQMSWVSTRAGTIYGGSSEINRNLVAERALGLPSWKTAARMAKEGKEVG